MADLAQAIRQFGNELLKQKHLSAHQSKTLLNILRCRTAALGWREEVCEHCSTVRYSYNSCGDRHCPRCQNTKQAFWVEGLVASTLPVKHYHVVFTVPHCLNDICLWNQQLFYQTLFKTVWSTLCSFGYTHYGSETGCVAVLHTWGQNLSLHPHIHCIVPAAGYDLKGRWKTIGINGKYLYPVHQLSDTFKGKFMDSLQRKLRKLKASGFDRHLQQAAKSRWVVYSEPPLANANKVIHYLGQYTHRVAISNQRILKVNDTHVTFVAKDYRDNAKKKTVSLKGEEFLRRFCQHILPKRFVRIRRYGIYNPTVIRNNQLMFVPDKPDVEQLLRKVQPETTPQRILRLTGCDITLCPHCKKGHLKTIKTVPRIRSPARTYITMLMAEL